MQVGKTAPGIVFEKLIHGLTQANNIDLITSDFNPSIDLSKVKMVTVLKKLNIHPKVSRFFISVFNLDPMDLLWALKSKVFIYNNNISDYDLIFSFISSGHYAALIAGKKIAKALNCKFAIYSTDAIPAPIGWIKYDSFYKGLRKMIANYMKHADAFYTTNNQLLDYQVSQFIPKPNMVKDVVFTPGTDIKKKFPPSNSQSNVFLYTGGIYGARKADYILIAFEKLLNIYSDSKLIFIGPDYNMINLSRLKPETKDRVLLLPFTNELDDYYANATALLDIDADLKNDVFISSKISNYLMINRIIISETGVNSPSRHLFKGIKSIIQCDHDSDQIFNAMVQAIKLKDKITFEDREEVIKLFSLDNIISRLNKSLRLIIN